MKKVTVWLDEKYNGVLTVTAVGNEAIRTNVAVAGTALEDADVIIIRPGGDIRYEKEGDYPSGPTGHLPSQGEAREEIRRLIIDADVTVQEAIDANDGYCPCAIERDEDTRCPCKEFREMEGHGECRCGRFEKVELV